MVFLRKSVMAGAVAEAAPGAYAGSAAGTIMKRVAPDTGVFL